MSLSDLILVVEDEPRLSRLVADYLKAAGYDTRIIDNGLDVMPAVRERVPALVLLDLMLPGQDGLAVCRELRAHGDTPVIMLTARVEEVDRLIGLESGADDYICKPFSPREVVARVRTVLRRWRAVPPSVEGAAARAALLEPAAALPVARLQIDLDSHRARFDGQTLDLTPVELRLLAALAAAPGRVFSRDQLLDRLHDDQRALSDRTVDSHVKNLRRKLEQVSPGVEPIRSIYGVGYRFEPPAGWLADVGVRA
ncbi:response regulator [Sphaerotilus natans]|uniref:response regulator n=1 Tax=Sphaerotilus natans TaxID=34103 RepID=UPI0009703F50|nr:response regulator [Sphaerotilus natans]